MKNIKDELKEYLKNQGFYYMERTDGFPSLIAWQAFIDPSGQPMQVITAHRTNPNKLKMYVPFAILGLEFIDKKFSEEKRKQALDLLDKSIITSFIVVSKKKGKLHLQEIERKSPEVKVEESNGQVSRRYIG